MRSVATRCKWCANASGSLNSASDFKWLAQIEKDMPTDAENTHLVNIGTLIQDMENKMLGREKVCLLVIKLPIRGRTHARVRVASG
jgi:hypothetical protein